MESSRQRTKDGEGQVDFGNGAFKSAYSFNSRFEDGKGTNPEELLGAAVTTCEAKQEMACRRSGNARACPGIPTTCRGERAY